MKNRPMLVLTPLLLLSLAIPGVSNPPGSGCGPLLPPQANAYGRSLSEWTEAYWRWYYTIGGAATTPYQPGHSPFVFMPLPQGEYISGSFTSEDPGYLQGRLEVTIRPGTSFFLPCFAWISERYNTGQADDPPIPNLRIRSVATHPSGTGVPQVTLNGRPILRNFWDYYVGPRPFNPIITYPEPTDYGSIGAIKYQGVGFIMEPLPRGTHTLHLFERLTVTNEDLPGYPYPYDLGVIYDNTWVIHVQ